MTGRRLGVLVSGRGSNLQAMIDAVAAHRLDAELAVVISNVPGAAALDRGARAGVDTLVLPHREYPSREEYDGALAQALQARGVRLVCLAGFMRLLGPRMIAAYPDAILNVHPSLLPAFPGLHAQRQALQHGVKVAGATVHLVDEHLDAGPILLQATVPVLDTDTEDTLAARILVEEHRIYPEAIATWLEGGWRIEGRRFVRAGHERTVASVLA